MQEIILKAQSGDMASLDYIIEKYKPLVVSLSRKYFLIGGTIEDLIQEGNLGLFKAITTFNSDKNCSFYTFSKLCIEKQLQNAIQKANRPKNKIWNEFERLDADNEEVFGSSVKDDSPSPEDIILSNEILDDLKDKINQKLSRLEKQVLYHFLKGESYLEIAQNLQVSKKCVDNALKRLRNKLSDFKDNI